MAKNLTIMKGDEYRAKIEQKFVKNGFFEEVYIKAQDIVNEIVLEIEEFCRQEKEHGGFRVKYQGMGNNIILFCAGRGQGKTSAMQSFARFLRGKAVEGKLKVDEKYHFHVLESIDPTALDGKESILRVLIARLFLEYEKAVSDQRFEDIDEREFKKENAALLELFQQCFLNIDYLKGEQGRDAGQDDLEYLAQLGNSAVLKANLQKLVAQFLQLTCSVKSCHKTDYLVVQIDDVDLSIVDVFGMCEDIRNYLSIPNVIILMAADYENLRDAVYKKYLEDNRIFWSEMEDEDRKAEYNTMASKYMEKVFPSGHRINLPQIDDALARGEDAIHISYQKVAEDGKRESLLSDEVIQCKELQEQLFLVIYRKTGAVFLKPEEGMHPFLPHTLRQLTHFLKLLLDMEDIDFRLAYRAAGEQVEDELSDKEVVKLKHNIRCLKSYFLDYWSASQLSYEERKTICRMEEVCKKKNSYKLWHFIKQTFDIDMYGRGADAYSYQSMIYRVRNSGDKVSEGLRDAIEIFFTIFFNEWFTQALREHKQYQKIKRFLGMSLALPLFYDKPRTLFFKTSVNSLNEFNQDWSEGQALSWLQRFCVPFDMEDKELESMVVRSNENKEITLNGNISYLKFDVLHAVLAVLDLDWEENSMDEESPDENESVSDQKAGWKGSRENVKTSESVSLLISAKNILANADVQRYLGNKMWPVINKRREANYIRFWNATVKYIYEIFDSWTEEASYLKEDSVMQQVGLRDIKDSSIWEQLYVCSEYKSDVVEYFIADTVGELNMIRAYLNLASGCISSTTYSVDDLKKCFGEGALDDELEKIKYKMNEFKDARSHMEKLKGDYEELLRAIHGSKNSEKEDESMTIDVDDIKQRIKVCNDDLDRLNWAMEEIRKLNV